MALETLEQPEVEGRNEDRDLNKLPTEEDKARLREIRKQQFNGDLDEKERAELQKLEARLKPLPPLTTEERQELRDLRKTQFSSQLTEKDQSRLLTLQEKEKN